MEDTKQQAREIINTLLGCSYNQTDDIVAAEGQLKNLYQQTPQSIETLIGLMLVNVMLGNRATALGLGDKIWGIGGNLSPFFELIYTDCLINLGETDKVGIILAPRFENTGASLKHFYTVFIRYALLTGRLSLIKKIGSYPGIYRQEAELFKFAEKYALTTSLKDYQAIVKIIIANLKDYLCAFDYALHDNTGIELLIYTDADDEQNEVWQDQLFDIFDNYFAATQRQPLDNIFVRLANISEHPAWFEDEN